MNNGQVEGMDTLVSNAGNDHTAASDHPELFDSATYIELLHQLLHRVEALEAAASNGNTSRWSRRQRRHEESSTTPSPDAS